MSTNLSHPFTAGRTEMMSGQGHQIEFVGYERGDPSGRQLRANKLTVLGDVKSGAYYRRVPLMLGHMRSLRRAIRHNDVICVNGADIALVVHLAGILLGKPVVRHVADIERILVLPGLRSRLLRILDRVIEGRCKLLVLTSSAAEWYYRDLLRVKTTVLVVENKVEPRIADVWMQSPYYPLTSQDGRDEVQHGKPLQDRPLRVGWFAQIRDQWSLDFIEALTQEHGDRFEVVMAGFAGPNIQGLGEFLTRNPTIRYLGPFRQVEDTPRLYASVDMSLACVLPELPTSLAMSSRFYASCMLRTPLIVRAGTAVAERVAELGIGSVLSQVDPREAAAEFAAVKSGELASWCRKMHELQPEVYLHTEEARRLSEALNSLVEN